MERERYCGEWVVAVNNSIGMGVMGCVQRYFWTLTRVYT